MSDKSRNKPQNTAPQLPFAPPPKNVRALRALVRLRNALGCCFVGGLSAVFLVLFLHQAPALKDYVTIPLLAACGFWIVGLYGTQWVNDCIKEYRRRRFRVDHVSLLTYWNDGVLPRAKSASLRWSLTGSQVRERAELLQQLRLLTEDTAYVVHDRERHALYKTLYGQDAELISAVLRAVSVLGDSRALPFLRHLAEGNGMAATNMQIRTEAQGSLERLQSVIDLSSGSQGLLRASSAPPAPEENLLHPVQGNHETDPRELLRADVQK